MVLLGKVGESLQDLDNLSPWKKGNILGAVFNDTCLAKKKLGFLG